MATLLNNNYAALWRTDLVMISGHMQKLLTYLMWQPCVTAMPCGAQALSTSAFSAPPPILTVGGSAWASTSTELNLLMSIIIIFDMETVECPPHLMAT